MNPIYFLKDFLALCDKYGGIQFYYTARDDGAVVEIEGEKVLGNFFSAEDIRREIQKLEGKP